MTATRNCAAAALFATLLGVWVYNSSAASGFDKNRLTVDQKIATLAGFGLILNVRMRRFTN